MVSVAVLLPPIVKPVGTARMVNVTVSVSSICVSFNTVTEKVAVVAPALKGTVMTPPTTAGLVR